MTDTSVLAQSFFITLADEAASQQLAMQLARHCRQGVIHLVGDLGAGKTTLTRYWLQALGHQGNVKSPTYTLIEPYEIKGQPIYHFDLYRLNDPYELELMGIRDYLEQPNALLLIEWPSKGEPIVPQADLLIQLTVAGEQRQATLTAHTTNGERVLQALQYVG
ncbi:MAG: tRNA (adenosine(37)-N6)-threonylcarbamoyltransferase complex ATPase subunit type 1 TsaE [Moraxellaceae bacterium]